MTSTVLAGPAASSAARSPSPNVADAVVWLADFVFLPRIAARRQSRLDASRATLLRQ
ncbi:MAG: hypothetical protein QOJ52_2704 [Acidimicrobiaceae bacterium]|nr:hypothetical protein [Acidimicrobiaceae bacterium]